MEREITQVQFLIPPKLELKRVAAYARVSSHKEAMLHSLSAQVSYYSELIQSHPDWVYCGVYSDEGLTGTKENRKDFQRLINDCRAGNLDMIITKSISRFARNTVTLLEKIRELKSLNVDVYFEEQNIHTISADGELLITILASYAQEESRSASENQKWRIRKGFQNGELVNLNFIYGYTIHKGSIVVNECEATIVREIFQRVIQGESLCRIAKDLNTRGVQRHFSGEWTSNRIRDLVSNEKYMGNALLQKTFRNNHIEKKRRKNNGELPKYYAEDTHEPIVDAETFTQAQVILGRISQEHDHSTPKHSMLTGMIRCGMCGKNYKRTVNNGHPFWSCSTYIQKGKAVCPSKRIPEATMQQVVYDTLKAEGVNEDTFNETVDYIQANSGNVITFHLYDGRTLRAEWKDRSRKESWTPEMKERARQKALAQFKKKET